MSVLRPIIYTLCFACFIAVRVAGQERPVQVVIDTLDIHAVLASAEQHLDFKQLDSAHADYMKTLAASNVKRYRYGIMKSLNGLGNVYAEKGDYDRALSAFQNALSYGDSTETTLLRVMAMIHNNIGSVHLQWNDYDQAIRYYTQSIRLHEKSGPGSGMHTPYSNLAVLMLKIKEPEKALKYLNTIENRLAESDNLNGLITVLLHKSRVYDYLKDTSRSDSCLYKVLAISDTSYKGMGQFTALVNLAGAAVDRNQPDRAIAFLQQASEKIATANNYYQVYYWNIKGAALALKKQYVQAQADMHTALNMAQAAGNLRGVSEAYKLLSEINAAERRFPDAYKYRQDYLKTEDSIYAQENIATTLRYETRYQTMQKDRQLLEEQRMIAAQKDKLRIRSILIAGSTATSAFLLLALMFIRNNHKYRQAWQEEEIQSLLRQQELGEMKAIMKGEEKERSRIAQDLHEGIMTRLAGIIHSVETLKQQSAMQPAEKLADISGEIDRMGAQLRITAHNLMPDMLLEEGISEAAFYFCTQLERSHPVKIFYEEISELGRFDPFFELTVYRIIQEILQNAVSDKGTTEILVQMNYDNRHLHITIEDNNAAATYTSQALYTHRHTTLEVIRARVLSLTGIMEIDKSPENGTSINLEFAVLRTTDNKSERNERYVGNA